MAGPIGVGRVRPENNVGVAFFGQLADAFHLGAIHANGEFDFFTARAR